MRATIWKDAILVHAASKHPALAAMPAANYVPRPPNGFWAMPVSLVSYRRLRRAFGDELQMSGDADVVDRLAAQSAAYDDAQQFKTMLDADVPAVPGELMPSWGHQRRGFHVASRLPSWMLAEGVGTGKSKQIVDVSRTREYNKVLIVTTASCVSDWPMHAEKHLPSGLYDVLALDEKIKTTAKKAKMLRDAWASSDRLIVSVSYDSVWRPPLGEIRDNRHRVVDDGLLMSLDFDLVVADESHNIGSPSNRRAQYLFRLADKARARGAALGCASATAAKHKPEDLFAQYRYLDPAVFGKHYGRFCDRYCEYNVRSTWAINADRKAAAARGDVDAVTKLDAELAHAANVPRFVVGYKNLDEMHALFHTLAYYCESDVLDLPEPVHVYRRCLLGAKAAKAYAELEDDLFTTLEDGTPIEAPNVLSKFLRLQQVTSGFVGETVYDPDTGEVMDKLVHALGDEKAELLREVFMSIEVDEPIVVFCRFKFDLQTVRRIATECGRRVFEQSGARKEKREFMSARGGEVLAGQIKSAGEGNDFTRARYAVFYSLGHSLYQYEQALGRLDRPGQTRQPCYIHLLADDTIDMRVYDGLRKRKEVIEHLMRGGRARARIAA